MKRVLRAVLLLGLLSVLVAMAVLMLGYGARKQKETVCGEVEVNIERRQYDIYLQNRDIDRWLAAHGINIPGKKAAQMDACAVENVLLQNPYISSAEVFVTQDGICRLWVDQRNPFLKVVSVDGQMYQIDRKGVQMPVNVDYAVRLRVASGYIPFAPQYGLNVTEIADTLPESVLKRLYDINAFLEANSLWDAMFEQIYVTYQGEYELVPKVGGQTVKLGKIEDMDDLAGKMKRLELFYRKCSVNGFLERYSVLNLKYRNQIVATRRPLFNGKS